MHLEGAENGAAHCFKARFRLAFSGAPLRRFGRQGAIGCPFPLLPKRGFPHHMGRGDTAFVAQDQHCKQPLGEAFAAL